MILLYRPSFQGIHVHVLILHKGSIETDFCLCYTRSSVGARAVMNSVFVSIDAFMYTSQSLCYGLCRFSSHNSSFSFSVPSQAGFLHPLLFKLHCYFIHSAQNHMQSVAKNVNCELQHGYLLAACHPSLELVEPNHLGKGSNKLGKRFHKKIVKLSFMWGLLYPGTGGLGPQYGYIRSDYYVQNHVTQQMYLTILSSYVWSNVYNKQYINFKYSLG